jgi:hypothetical protein
MVQRCLRRPAPQLQVPLVARPRLEPARNGLSLHRVPPSLPSACSLVASGLRRVAAICNVLQGCREKSFNSLRVLRCGRELLICGLWVRFPPGSPEILTKTANREIEPQVETLSETLTRQNRVKLRRRVCLERGQDMAVRVERQRYLRVPERFHDSPRIDALRQQQRGSRVPQIVKPNGGRSALASSE